MSTPTARPPDVPLFSVAGTFLEALAVRDLARLTATLTDTAHLSALVPGGLQEADGPAQIGDTVRRWFGGAQRFELVDAVVGAAGTRLHLRWRLRVHDELRGPGPFVVDQQLYADTGPEVLNSRRSALCCCFCH